MDKEIKIPYRGMCTIRVLINDVVVGDDLCSPHEDSRFNLLPPHEAS